MHWKQALKYIPSDWTIEEVLCFIQLDCPEVTMQDLKNALN